MKFKIWFINFIKLLRIYFTGLSFSRKIFSLENEGPGSEIISSSRISKRKIEKQSFLLTTRQFHSKKFNKKYIIAWSQLNPSRSRSKSWDKTIFTFIFKMINLIFCQIIDAICKSLRLTQNPALPSSFHNSNSYGFQKFVMARWLGKPHLIVFKPNTRHSNHGTYFLG